jgi:hypothetical protein
VADIEAAFAPARTISDPLPRQRVLGLITRMAKTARSTDDADHMLDVLGRMATQTWVEGQLAVVFRHQETGVEIDLLTYDGLSYTRLIQPLSAALQLAEIVQLVALRGGLVGALGLLFDEPGVELQLAAYEPPPPSMAVMDDDEEPLSRRRTARIAVKIPPEAQKSHPQLPPPEPQPEPQPSGKRPGAYSIRPTDGSDDGWE